MSHHLLFPHLAKATVKTPAPATPPSTAPTLGSPPPEIAALRARMTGKVLAPGDDGYDTARRFWDPRFDRHPALIAQCANEADVGAALAVARQFALPFRVRSGGHCFAGFSATDGMLIDVAALATINIDAAALTATVGAGCPFQDFYPALQQLGLWLPLGNWPDVRVAGFMQGGGAGLTSRTHGMNCDHVLALRMMLADGAIIDADATTNRDLWWAVRGGTGGQFGVLLSITYRLVRLAGVAEKTAGWKLATPDDVGRAAAVMLEVQRRFARGTGTPALNLTALIVWSNPATGDGPPDPWLVLDANYAGTAEDCAAALAPLLALPGAVPDFMPNPVHGPGPMPALARAARFISRDLDAAEWRAVLTSGLASPNRMAVLFIECQGNAINAIPPERSAYVHRDSAFNVWLDVMWNEPAEQDSQLAFQRNWCAAMAPFWNGHVYQNFPNEDLVDWRHNYWGRAFEALAAVKHKYDPEGFFDFPQAAVMEHGKRPNPSWPDHVVSALARPIVK